MAETDVLSPLLNGEKTTPIVDSITKSIPVHNDDNELRENCPPQRDEEEVMEKESIVASEARLLSEKEDANMEVTQEIKSGEVGVVNSDICRGLEMADEEGGVVREDMEATNQEDEKGDMGVVNPEGRQDPEVVIDAGQESNEEVAVGENMGVVNSEAVEETNEEVEGAEVGVVNSEAVKETNEEVEGANVGVVTSDTGDVKEEVDVVGVVNSDTGDMKEEVDSVGVVNSDTGDMKEEVDGVGVVNSDTGDMKEEVDGVGVVNSDTGDMKEEVDSVGVVNSDTGDVKEGVDGVGVVNSDTGDMKEEVDGVGVVNSDTGDMKEEVDGVGVVNSDTGDVKEGVDDVGVVNSDTGDVKEGVDDVGVVNSDTGDMKEEVDGVGVVNSDTGDVKEEVDGVGVVNSESVVSPLSSICETKFEVSNREEGAVSHHDENGEVNHRDGEEGVANHHDLGNNDGDVTDHHNIEEGVTNHSTDQSSVEMDKELGVSDSNDATEDRGLSDATDGIPKADPKTTMEEDETKVVPKKRMTRAQKAIVESLATFGGSSFDSISVRKVDFRSKLKKEANKLKEKEREESGEEPPRKRPRTRLSIAREESIQNFQNTALGEGAKKKYPKVTIAKNKSKNATGSQEVTAKYQTRVKRSQAMAMESFGGAVLDDLPVRKKAKLQSNSSRKYALSSKRKSVLKSKVQTPNDCLSDTGHRLTSLEKAKLEAVQNFGGNSLNDVLVDCTKKVSKTLNPSKPVVGSKRRTRSRDNTSESHDVPDD